MPIITIKAIIHADEQTKEILRDAMLSATKVYNGLLWHLRDEYKRTGKVKLTRSHLNKILKILPRANNYFSQSVIHTRDEVIGAYKSFLALKKQGIAKVEAPGFRKKQFLSPLKYHQGGFKIEGNTVTISLGTKRQDGIKQVSFKISHRPDIQYSRVKMLSIVYDRKNERFEARLTVEVSARENNGKGKVAVDVGENMLMTCAFDDGTVAFYRGGLIKSIRRYWQKVRAHLKRGSRRWKQIAHREWAQVEHLLHTATSHFIKLCLEKGVKEIAIGFLKGIRNVIDYGDKLNQRLHNWAFRKLINMIKYKASLAGMVVHEVEETHTSATCHCCGNVKKSNRKTRGLYRCSCGWKVHADINGALNIFRKVFKVSPIEGSSGLMARPRTVSFLLGWNGVLEPTTR